jgi:hypothetical protein
MAKKKYESVRISLKAKKKLQPLCENNDITMVKSLDRLLQIESAFTNRDLYQDEVDKVRKEPYYQQSLDEITQLASGIVRNSIATKPPSAIIDASILYSFKQLGKKTLTRKDIKDAVINMMQESTYPTTWSRVYHLWWENYQRNKSKFELDFDNRLRRLVKDKLISNEPKSGEYSHNLNTKHWEYVQRLATSFYPQIVIDKIASITF